MADLTIDNLIAHLPDGTMTLSGDDIKISLNGLLGRTATSWDTECVAGILSKLALAASAAQSAYNAVPENTDLASYPNPTMSPPTRNAAGLYVSRRTHTINVQLPFDGNEILAV